MKRQKYIQQHIFDDDEVIIVRSSKQPMRYSERIQGARDMLLAHLHTYNRNKMRYLARPYMKALIEVLLTNKSAFQKWIDGNEFKFETTRNSTGAITNIKVIIKNKK